MASYLDQIPKQLAARRKAFAAAAKNPALLPSCWAIVRSIANNMYDYMRNSVIGGCTFPDRPVHLSAEDAAFLNFGATPRLLARDAAWLEAESGGQPPPEDADAPLPPETASRVRRRLALLAGMYGANHHATGVYNLEAWLQDMYRDRLDVDFAEDLQRQIDSLNAYMDSVPVAIASTGLSGRLSKGVMDAFNLFKTVTGSSHQLDREKMSFVDRRSYVDTIQKIERIMQAADENLGSAVAGRSVVREMFALWKNANYEMMALTRQLRVLWAGTSLDDRIAELADLLGAVQKALNRCAEESRQPSPQLPIVRADDDNDDPVARRDVVDAFRAVLLYDFVLGGDNTLLAVRETRKFGPLAVVLAPGSGQPRYCWEIRKLAAGDEDGARRIKQTASERDVDVDRRIRYPLNCLVVPINVRKRHLAVDIADGWLEFNQFAFPVQFREFLESVKNAVPEVFLPPQDREAGDLPPFYARQALARLSAAFVRWAHDGTEPDGEEAPAFEKFRELALSRLDDKGFLVPPRYRPFVQMFAEAGDKRRTEMWKRCLGPRFALDRQLVAVSILMKDWDALRDHLKLLPSGLVKGNSNIENGFARSKDVGDPFSGHKALGHFRKFLEERPDLKSAMVSVESQASIEVETLRTQAESLGRVFQYDQAAHSMMQRQLSQIQERRLAANRHIDLYLTGLMYAFDGNLEAAESALAGCLTPLADRESDEASQPSVGEEAGEEWFEANLKPRDGKFGKRPVPGEDASGTVCHDLLYYNLGVVYMKMNRHEEALMCWAGVRDVSPPEASFLYRLWAERHARVASERISLSSEGPDSV